MEHLNEEEAKLLREILVGMMLGFVAICLVLIGYVWGYNAPKHTPADTLIERIIEDCPDYYLDVLVETDEWENYSSFISE